MAELIARTPCAGLLPRTAGRTEITEAEWTPLYLIAPFRGREEDVAQALGLGWPAPDRSTTDGARRAVWTGPGQALVSGDLPDLPHCAVTDQSDAFAVVRLAGPEAEAVLARLVPIDLRAAAFPPGASARTLLGHMTATVIREDGGAFTLMVFRSMAGTLVHELVRAAEGVETRRRA